MAENWRAAEGWEGLYEVSDQGRVRSVDHVCPVSDVVGRIYTKHIRGRTRMQSSDTNGYLHVTFTSPDGKRQNAMVHRLVAEAFLENPDGLLEVNHKDGDKTNNAVSNLEWCTRIENMRHSNRVLHPVGNRAKLSPEQVREIRASSESCGIVARRFGVCRETVRNIRTGRTYLGVV